MSRNTSSNIIPRLSDPRMLRHVAFDWARRDYRPLGARQGYRLKMWDTYRTDGMVKSVLGYAFYQPGSRVPLFCGEDFYCSPCHAIDSDETVRSLLCFLTLKPGDTDSDYFDGYTDSQMEFARGEAEYLSEWGMEESYFANEGHKPPRFRNLMRF